MQIKWQYAAALVAIAFLLGLLLAQGGGSPGGSSPGGSASHEKQVLRTRIDTAHSVILVPSGRIGLHGRANRHDVISAKDTALKQACLDTLLTSDTSATAPDTLSVCFARDVFSVRLGLSPRRKMVAVPYIAHDTFISREDTIRMGGAGGRAWYDDVLVVVLSVAAGIIIGKI